MSTCHGRIFLLDDEELIISMLARALTKAGFTTRTETSAQNAVRKIVDWRPDVVLLDINLNDNKDGLDILAEIKAESPDIEIVMLTGDDTAESRARAMKLGAVAYLNKPFNVDDVKTVIAGLLKKNKPRKTEQA